MIRYLRGHIRIHRSARKHGRRDGDIRHAHRMALIVVALDLAPPLRTLVLGPSRSGVLLELVTLDLDSGIVLVIHAMNMRPRYAPLLQEGLHD